MGRAERRMGSLFTLVLLVAIGGSAFWLVEPLIGSRDDTSGRDAGAGVVLADEPDGGAAGGDDGAPGADATNPPGEAAAYPSAAPGSDPLGLAASGYAWPLSGAKITTYFDFTAGGSMILQDRPVHNGLDLARPCGTPVRAAHDGTVVYAGRRADPYLGFSGSVQPYYDELARRKLTARTLAIIVVVDDGNGLISVYVHLAKATVKAGQAVEAGTKIGLEGATGNATGCHLHYSLFLAEGPWVAVAPDLVENWHYPPSMRLRVDPLLVLPPDSADAGRPARGLAPPDDPPRYVTPTPTPLPTEPPPGWF